MTTVTSSGTCDSHGGSRAAFACVHRRRCGCRLLDATAGATTTQRGFSRSVDLGYRYGSPDAARRAAHSRRRDCRHACVRCDASAATGLRRCCSGPVSFDSPVDLSGGDFLSLRFVDCTLPAFIGASLTTKADLDLSGSRFAGVDDYECELADVGTCAIHLSNARIGGRLAISSTAQARVHDERNRSPRRRPGGRRRMPRRRAHRRPRRHRAQRALDDRRRQRRSRLGRRSPIRGAR